MQETKIDRRFTLMAALFCVCLVVANIFENKVFNAGAITLTGGFVLFPLTYILNDCITEIYGYKNARFVIILAFATNLFILACSQLVRILPADPAWDGGAHFDYIFNTSARICLASVLAFVTGSLLNAKVMSRMKEKNAPGGFGWRAIASTFIGESADSLIFFPIAFWGYDFKGLLIIMGTQIMLKTLYEIIVLPVTSRVVRRIQGRTE